jgi:phosphoserine phosphatase RsbU/P
MDEQLNYAPGGFLTLSEDGIILSSNQTLLEELNYSLSQIRGQHINKIFTKSAQLFYQLYFVPLMKVSKRVEEMFLSLESKDRKEIPVLLNAQAKIRQNETVIECFLIPIRQREEFENALLKAKKEAEEALMAKNKAVSDLEDTLKSLEEKQAELLKLNEQNQKYKIETKKELELARKIQETTLTDSISNDFIQIEAFYQASHELSGDIYGLYQIDKDRYGIIILDVMGHGISSSLITMSVQSLFQRLISKEGNPELVIKELDQHLHNLFQNNEEARHYCTAIYLLINTKEKKIDYINAGHPPAFLQCSQGIQELNSSVPPIGTFEGIQFKTTTIPYESGCRLLLYTDGVTDPFGFNHLKPLLQDNETMSMLELKEMIIQSMSNTELAYHQSDDKCFLLVDLF